MQTSPTMPGAETTLDASTSASAKWFLAFAGDGEEESMLVALTPRSPEGSSLSSVSASSSIAPRRAYVSRKRPHISSARATPAPRRISETKPARKLSPAPVASTARIGRAGRRSSVSAFLNRQPRPPSLTIAFFTPQSRKTAAISAASARPV